MMDTKTRAYLRELANAVEANRKAVDAAQEVCMCADSMGARSKKTMSACDNAKIGTLNVNSRLSILC